MKRTMRPELQRLLDILRKHPGKDNAISMLDLYELFSGETVERDEDDRPLRNVATLSRRMRNLIDELIIVHAIPVMSSSAGGYWIVTDEKELAEVYKQFMSRGLSSLQKAARLKKISLVDAVQQLALDLDNENSDIAQHVTANDNSLALDLGELSLSKEAKLAAITKHMQTILSSPDDYEDELAALQKQFGPKLLPKSVLDSIHNQAEIVRELATRTIDAANKLEQMI